MMMRNISGSITKLSVLSLIAGAVVLLVSWDDGAQPEPHGFHTDAEREAFRGAGSDTLAFGQNTYFMASGNCGGCHGHDPSAYSMVTTDGRDVNVVDAWRSSIMANAARDPFWRAKVKHETLMNPAHQIALEDKCTKCHAPMGNFESHFTGQGMYAIATMVQDPIALDGVSCVACHIQTGDSIGDFFSGQLRFDTLGRPLYGPYADDDIFGAPMEAFVGYTPHYGAQILDAGLCAGCHTLLTETVDINGEFTGDEFVEQATYHEWLNSEFNNEQHPETGITCQGCHVPLLDDDIGVVLSANYIFLQPKTPFGEHHFVGANTFMLNMLKEHGDTLEVTAKPSQFDSTIARTERMLRQHTLLLNTTVPLRNVDTAYIDVKLTNLAGHKFPSGYPARRAWVQLVVATSTDTLFNNGAWSDDNEVVGIDPLWEPHHDVITATDQVQIYEMVMGDVNGDITTVLERAKAPLKDDRLAPAGFTTDHFAYDTTQIVGVPASDVDFNMDENGVEGSGSDIIHYHVPMDGYGGLVHITTKVWYQSAPPRSMVDMFTHSAPEIDLFKSMYEVAGDPPFLVSTDSIADQSTGIDDLHELGLTCFPNPVRNGILNISGIDARTLDIELYDTGGRLVATRSVDTGPNWKVRLPNTGTYVVVVRTAERNFVTKVVSF